MFYAWEIAEFREQLAFGMPSGKFKKLQYERRSIELSNPDLNVTTLEDGCDIDFTGPSRVFGQPFRKECLNGVVDAKLRSPAKAIQRVRGGSIIGLCAVIDRDGHLYTPAAVSNSSALRTAIARNLSNAEGYVLQLEGGQAHACFFVGPERRTYPSTALFITNMEIGNYGSFLVRMLPQLLAVDELEQGFDCYVVSDRPSWLLDAIRLLGLPELPILTVQDVCGDSFENVLIFDFCDTEGLLSPKTVSRLRAISEGVRNPSISTGMGRKIYVSRALSRIGLPQYRPLHQEIRIEILMKDRGYSIFYPETVSFQQQIATFYSADRIIGPSGSGMLNTVFSKPGSKVVDCESYTVAVRQHAKVYSSTGKMYSFCFGNLHDPSGELSLSPWSIADDLLTEALGWLE